MFSPSDLTRLPQTDPLHLYRYRDGLYAADLLTAAVVELDFFTWLADHPSDPATICRELATKPRPTDVMLTLFAANGYIAPTDGVFAVTDLAREHLVRSSPWFIGPYFASLRERPVVQDFLAILRTDRPAGWGSLQDHAAWNEAMLTPEFAAKFTSAMDCRGGYLGAALARALNLTGRRRALDIAGGSGIYACALVANHSQLTAAVWERPPVDAIARTMIEQRGCAARVEVLSGDMFVDPLPGGFDLHLFSNVLHDWDVPKVRKLLAASFAALEPDGMIVVHDAHLNADKTGPLPVAAYSALLMSVTEGRCYSISEMESYLGEAGFCDVNHQPTVADRSVVTARKPG